MVFSDYAPLDHILPRYLSVALLRRLNRKNIKTVGHSSLRWVGLASERTFNATPTPPIPPPPDSTSSLGSESPEAAVAKDLDGAATDGDNPAELSGPIVLPPPESLSLAGPNDSASGQAVTATGSGVSSPLAGDDQQPATETVVEQGKRRQRRRRLQVMTAHSFDHLDTATHSTDRVVLAGVVSPRFVVHCPSVALRLRLLLPPLLLLWGFTASSVIVFGVFCTFCLVL